MKLGFNCAGTETVFERVLLDQIGWYKAIAGSDSFNYLEIGIAEGTTLLAVARVLEKQTPFWNAIGVDLYGGAFFNAQNFLNQCKELNVEILYAGLETKMDIMPKFHAPCVSVCLMPDGRHFGEELRMPKECFHLAVIDGCHGAPCVERDFLAVEPWIAPGGIVAFHDAMPEDQGQHWQAHCQQNINVRQALENLRLPFGNPPTGTPRPGWEFVCQVPGDKSANPPGNGFMFFGKV